MWLLGLIHLLFLFHRSTNTSGCRAMKKKMQALGVVPDLYTFARFSQPVAVYMKAQFPRLNDRGFANVASTHNVIYIGSTHLKLAQREHNGLAKFKQLHPGKLPEVEVAQRYWPCNGNYHTFTTIQGPRACAHPTMATQPEFFRSSPRRLSRRLTGSSQPTNNHTKAHKEII